MSFNFHTIKCRSIATVYRQLRLNGWGTGTKIWMLYRRVISVDRDLFVVSFLFAVHHNYYNFQYPTDLPYITLDLWTLLEILPSKDLRLSEDADELKALVIKHCSEEKILFVGPHLTNLRTPVRISYPDLVSSSYSSQTPAVGCLPPPLRALLLSQCLPPLLRSYTCCRVASSSQVSVTGSPPLRTCHRFQQLPPASAFL